MPEAPWPKLAERIVSAIERIADSYDFEESPDPIRGQVEIIMSIHAEYHDRLENILVETDQFKKAQSLRDLTLEARTRSQQAQRRLQSMDGEETEVGQRSTIQGSR